jgi:hypothetical protein
MTVQVSLLTAPVNAKEGIVQVREMRLKEVN